MNAPHDDQADRHEFDRLYRATSYPADKIAPLTPLVGFMRCKPPARCSSCGGRFDNLHAETRTCIGCTPERVIP